MKAWEIQRRFLRAFGVFLAEEKFFKKRLTRRQKYDIITLPLEKEAFFVLTKDSTKDKYNIAKIFALHRAKYIMRKGERNES